MEGIFAKLVSAFLAAMVGTSTSACTVSDSYETEPVNEYVYEEVYEEAHAVSLPQEVAEYVQGLGGEVEVYGFSGLTAEMLENRNGKVIVEVLHGVCLDDEGNGETQEGYYLSYRSVDGFSAGKHYVTYDVYNPGTNAIDDIIARFDYEE